MKREFSKQKKPPKNKNGNIDWLLDLCRGKWGKMTQRPTINSAEPSKIYIFKPMKGMLFSPCGPKTNSTSRGIPAPAEL